MVCLKKNGLFGRIIRQLEQRMSGAKSIIQSLDLAEKMPKAFIEKFSNNPGG